MYITSITLGSVPRGLNIHPDGSLIYPLGSSIVIDSKLKLSKAVPVESQATEDNDKENRGTSGLSCSQDFLLGHTDTVTALAVTRSGKWIASGQKTHIGFKAPIFLWDYSKRELLAEFPELHKVKIQDLDFSPCERYLASLGGKDCNTLVVYRTTSRKVISLAEAATDAAICVRFFNHIPDECEADQEAQEISLVTGGYYHLRKWSFAPGKTGLTHVDANLGTLRRIFSCVALSADNRFIYGGTTTGDILQIDLKSTIPMFKLAGHQLHRNGIRSLLLDSKVHPHELIAGTGSGDVVFLNARTLKRTSKQEICVSGGVTSVVSEGEGFYLGTNAGNVYRYPSRQNTRALLLLSSPSSPVRDVCHLENLNAVFLTASGSEIRVWSATSFQEMLRIQLRGLKMSNQSRHGDPSSISASSAPGSGGQSSASTCTCICVHPSGTLILSGWSDGKIRAFLPETGKLFYVIDEAHKSQVLKSGAAAFSSIPGVSALAICDKLGYLISGGVEGNIRVWDAVTRRMIASLKEHKLKVTSIKLAHDSGLDLQINGRSFKPPICLSSSEDGSCVVWDLANLTRIQAVFSNTMYRSASFTLDNTQFLSCGSDRKVLYYDSDGSILRDIDASNAEIMDLEISANDRSFVIAGKDKKVKVFDYDLGKLVATGTGHSASINKLSISPDQKTIVTVGEDGSIFIWDHDFQQ